MWVSPPVSTSRPPLTERFGVGKRTNPAWYGKTWKAEVEPADLVTARTGHDLGPIALLLVGKTSPRRSFPRKNFQAAPVPPCKTLPIGSGVHLFDWNPLGLEGARITRTGSRVNNPGTENPPGCPKAKGTGRKKTSHRNTLPFRGTCWNNTALHCPNPDALPLPYEPEQTLFLAVTHCKTRALCHSVQANPTTVYILNARGAGLFPE